MVRFAEDKDYDFRILRAVEAVNEGQKLRLVAKMEAHFGALKGKRIAVWGLAFKPKTDDMREAPAVPLIKGLLAAGASVHAYDPEAMTVARGIFGGEDPLRRQQLRGAHRRGRPGDRHRVERVPRARLHADAEADAQPGHLRRAQHLQPGEHAGARLHLYFDGAAMSAVLVAGGAGYIGSHAVKALRARGESVIVFDNFSQGHREATGHATAVVEGDIQDTAKLVATIRAHGVDAVMHFAAWLSVGDSVKDPAGYYRNNVGGHAVGARRDGDDRRPPPRVLVDVRRLRHAGHDADPRGPAEAPDQRLRRDQAGHRARAAALRDGVRPAQHRPALLQRRGRRPRRRARRGSRARDSRHPARARRGHGARLVPHLWR